MDTLPTRRMKRSRSLVMTTAMATVGISLSACDDPAASAWSNASIAQDRDRGAQVEAFPYASLQACKDANEVPDAACETSQKAALADEANAPRFDERRTCEEIHGVGECVPRTQNGQSFWGPLVAGFVVGRMLDGGFRGTGYYRDREGGYATGYGGRLSTDYATGRTSVSTRGIEPPDAIRQAPPKVQTRTSVLSRGGFGGRMSASSGYSGRGFGA
jgi:uncharacterized protein YgiB involved in biofilm formation